MLPCMHFRVNNIFSTPLVTAQGWKSYLNLPAPSSNCISKQQVLRRRHFVHVQRPGLLAPEGAGLRRREVPRSSKHHGRSGASAWHPNAHVRSGLLSATDHLSMRNMGLS